MTMAVQTRHTWDPANPLKYNYDPANYDRADYAKFKQARLDYIAKRDANVPSFEESNKRLAREIKKAVGDRVAEEKSATKKKPTKGEIKRRLANGGELSVSTPSDCFESIAAVDAGDGMVLVTATFANPTRGDWDYLMPLDDFLDWANDDLGVAFNEWVRGNYEA
jgi:hypothetical protein